MEYVKNLLEMFVFWPLAAAFGFFMLWAFLSPFFEKKSADEYDDQDDEIQKFNSR